MLPSPERNKYKLAHIRVLPTCLVYLMAGILSATVDVWWITLLIALFVIALTILVIFTLTRRRVLAVVCLLLFVLGAATCFHSALAVHRRIQPLPENTRFPELVCDAIQTKLDAFHRTARFFRCPQH